MLDSIRSSLPQQPLDAHTLDKLKTRALAKAKALQEQVQCSVESYLALAFYLSNVTALEGGHKTGQRGWHGCGAKQVLLASR